MKGATRRKHSLTRSIHVLLLTGMGAFALGSCAVTPQAPPEGAYYRSAPAPDWHHLELSWGKLDRIQRWLDGAGPRRWPDALPGAELELAQGRLRLATQEHGKLSTSIISARLDRAETGFERVLANAKTSVVQRREASSGLASVRSQRTNPGSGALIAQNGAQSGAAKVAVNEKPDGIISRASWGARQPNTRSLTEKGEAWRRITVHHSATEVGGSDFSSAARAVKKVQADHMARPVRQGSSSKWGDIGYHFLIDSSGRVLQGRSLTWRGAHAGNSTTNAGNIGICLLGNFESRMPSAKAMASLEALIRDLRARHAIKRKELYGHKHFNTTACPGGPLLSWVRRQSGKG